MEHPNKTFMREAIQEAKRAANEGQYAIGAVVVLDDKILSVAHTTLHQVNDPTAHAEINAIRIASEKIGSRYLQGAWLYTTQEPCPMCTSAAIWAKMEGIVYGASKDDAFEIFKKQKDGRFSWRQIDVSAEDIIAKGEPKLRLHKGFLREECLLLYDLNK